LSGARKQQKRHQRQDATSAFSARLSAAIAQIFRTMTKNELYSQVNFYLMAKNLGFEPNPLASQYLFDQSKKLIS
jgi:DUF1365 family protein